MTNHFRIAIRHAIGAVVYAPLVAIVWTNDRIIDAMRSVRRWAYECDAPF